MSTNTNKKGLNCAEPGTSLDLSTIDLDQSSEEEQQGANYQCHSVEEKNNEQMPITYEEEHYKEIEALNSTGCDKLAILHMRLKNEAIKLENWKNDMISKLNKNEEKLAEANSLVASLRRSNLELQMDRENASLRVKDEVEKREMVEKRIIGTRDLCEAIKTQIEFVQSVCSSTMQTCFKTATTQKALETLLENTFKDFQNLSIQLDETKDRNRNLAETQEQLNEKHEHEMDAVTARNGELTTELEKLALEKEDLASAFEKCAENLNNQALKVQRTYESLELLFEAGSKLNFGLEEEIKRVNIELSKMKALTKEKETQMSESLNKCSQLSDDLSRVYTLLQNSKHSCLERGQKITALEEEIKRLTEEKGSIQNELHKKHARKKENELRLRIEEKERLAAEKDQLITTFKNARDGYLKEVETLKFELVKSEEKYKDLEESHRTLASSLVNEKKCLAETEERLACLQKNEEVRSKEISDLKNQTSTQKDEIEELTTKARNLECDQSRLNSRNQDMSRCIELKNDQIVRLEERLHEAEQQLRVLENAAARAGQEVLTSSSSLAQRDAEVSQLREALHTAQADHATALRHCEEVRAELLGAVEQQQQESDRVLRQKEKEIGSLKETLAALQKEADKSSKKIERRLTDNVAHVEKLKDQLKETVQEKKDLSKQLTASKQKMMKLEKEFDEKKALLSEMEEKVENLDTELTNLSNEKAKLTAALSTKDAELERLRYIEAEFLDFKHSIMNNSPPCSTQIPKPIEAEVQRTPHSPLLSEKFNHMVLLKTPQKTPKSILKQPGSECKRRRVLLISPEKTPPHRGCFEVESEPEDEAGTGLKTVETNSETCPVEAQPPFKPAPPRTPNIRGTPQTRTANIRKTPGSSSGGRGPPTNTRPSTRLGGVKGPTATTGAARVATPVAASSWFDSDETFGLNTEE
ncbi:Laminin subunit alpha-2 [Taenia crassiceps]|uniref:Laminin subunit alpha-2 n=1 Tax=Taenia crassiceps TaxID=6207 RepID=A0ABR4Q379_9CEST